MDHEKDGGTLVFERYGYSSASTKIVQDYSGFRENLSTTLGVVFALSEVVICWWLIKAPSSKSNEEPKYVTSFAFARRPTTVGNPREF